MSRSRWYEQRKGWYDRKERIEWQTKRDDWRSWAPMAIPNRRKRKRKAQRIEHYLYLIKQDERLTVQSGASEHQWAHAQREVRVVQGGNVTFGRWPLTKAKADPCCSPRDDAD